MIYKGQPSVIQNQKITALYKLESQHRNLYQLLIKTEFVTKTLLTLFTLNLGNFALYKSLFQKKKHNNTNYFSLKTFKAFSHY